MLHTVGTPTRHSLVVLGFLGLLCAALSGGCGYSLAGRGAFLPAYIKTIGIPQIINRTSVFNLEGHLTDKVRSEFIGRGKYKIVTDATGVDAVLNAEVLRVDSRPVNFTPQQLATRYTLTMTLRVELHDERSGKPLWQNPGLMFSEDFDVATASGTLDPRAFLGQDANALDRMTTDSAKTIVSAILEAF